jgi:hypothetical protein
MITYRYRRSWARRRTDRRETWRDVALAYAVGAAVLVALWLALVGLAFLL